MNFHSANRQVDSAETQYSTDTVHPHLQLLALLRMKMSQQTYSFQSSLNSDRDSTEKKQTSLKWSAKYCISSASVWLMDM